jgi:Ca-activated chloride channel family protein
MKRHYFGLVTLAALTISTQIFAQAVTAVHDRPLAPSIIIPQSRSFSSIAPRPVIQITGVEARVSIVEQVATTTMLVSLRNTSRTRREAEMIVPVPDGAVVRGFTFQGAASEPTAQVLPKAQARRIYDSIVAKMRDPALLEFIGYNLIRSSVFPIEAGGTQRIQLTYEHLLPADAERIDYVLPRSESLEYGVPWKVTVDIRSKGSISTVYSPSHDLETTRVTANRVTARLASRGGKEPGSFRLSYLLERDGVTASLFAYPDPKIGGGYFLLLAGLPAKPKPEKGVERIKREVTLVIDRSGSMSGEKIEQVREASMQIIAGLEDGEFFNILVYSNSVDMFAERPIVKTKDSEAKAREYLKSIRPGGGTNIHDALVEALRQKPTVGALPLVLFLTDGLPTVGQTSEVAIREIAKKSNSFDRRIFTFGVGVDVNSPLLDKIAVETRAISTFVLPKEDVEVKVASVFRRLSGPVLATPTLKTIGPDGAVITTRISDQLPAKLPDLFSGDQLIVLGKYRDDQKLHFKLAGNYLGQQRTFDFQFGLEKATTRFSFVPRLWASREIAILVEAIRELGAGTVSTSFPPRPTVPSNDPRLKELVDEIVRLSTEFGILTEYTAFLAREGTDLTRKGLVLQQALFNCTDRAFNYRSGIASLNQERNKNMLQQQKALNYDNRYWDSKMNSVSVTSIQQIADLAFYRRGNQWIDSRLVDDKKKRTATKTIEFGSPEFLELAHRLAKEGRQGSIALRGDILLSVDGQSVLIKGPTRK